MPSTLRRFGTASAMELRLLCRHWSYALLHLLWAALLIYANRGVDLDTARWELENSFGFASITLISLVTIFVAGASASRVRRLRFELIDETLPTGTEVVLGRAVAVVVAMLPFTVVPLLFALRAGPRASFIEALPIFAGEALITIVITTAVTWWFVTSTVGRGRWAYLLPVGAWLAANIGPEFLSTFNVALPEATLLQFGTGRHSDYDDLWNRMRANGMPRWADLFYLGLALGFVALIAARVQLRRLRRRPIASVLALLVAVLAATFGGARFVRAIDVLEARLAVDERVEEAHPSSWREEDQDALVAQAPRITRYLIDADLSEPAHPRFAATITLHNAGSTPLARFPLTLNHDFEIDQADVPFTRNGNAVEIELPEPLAPGATRDVAMQWGGALWSGQRTFSGMPQALFFTEPWGMRLSTAVGWYPIAGQVPTRFTMQSLPPERMHPPADFRLIVKAGANFPVASNLPPAGPNVFEGEGAAWVMLIGSPELAVEQVGKVRLIAARNTMPALRTVVDTYERTLAAYLPFFPDARVDGLTLMVLDENVGIESATPPAAGQFVVVLSRGDVNAGQRTVDGYPSFFIGYALASDLWVLSGGEVSYASSVVANFLWEMHTGQPPYRGSVEGPDPLQPLLAKLQERYKQEGAAPVIELFQRMRAELTLEEQDNPQRVIAWLEEALGAS